MEKIALLFPGVGSQYVGMGKTLSAEFPVFYQTFVEASDRLHLDMLGLCRGDRGVAELSRLDNAQLLVFTYSIALFRIFEQRLGLKPAFCLGHSLGEYSALCAAGVMPFPVGLDLVKERASIISRVSSTLDGTMMWVINLDQEKVAGVCREMTDSGRAVYVSAFDSPTQTSISGPTGAIMAAARQLEKLGAIVYPLKLAGPFHCPLMAAAAKEMAGVLAGCTFADPLFPVVANCSAAVYAGKETVADNLSRQLVSPIRFRDSISWLVGQGVSTAVEIGPKDVLKFLLKKNTPAIRAFSLDNQEDTVLLENEFLLKPEEYGQVIGRCLGAAVSTPNRTADREMYEKGVVLPYTHLSALYRGIRADGENIGRAELDGALAMLRLIMRGKGAPEAEQEKKIQLVLGGKGPGQ